MDLPHEPDGPVAHVRQLGVPQRRDVLGADEDRSIVPGFVKEEGWTAPIVYAQGLDQILSIRALPTTMILGPDGRVIFRQAGINIPTFVDTLESKIRDALK